MDENSAPNPSTPQDTSSETSTPHPKKSGLYKYALIGIFVITGVTLGSLVFITKNDNQTMPKNRINASSNAEKVFLTITSPKDATFAVNDEIVVSGRTLPDTTVAIYSDVDETIVDSDSQGNFESTIIFDQTSGLIRVTAFAANGEEQTQTITLTENDSVLGVSDKEKGKSNEKSDNSQNKQANKPEDKQENKPVKDESPKPTVIKQSNESSNPKPTKTKEKQINDSLTAKGSGKTEKLGGMKIRELTQEGTKSADLTGKELKIDKKAAKTATNGAVLKRHAVSGVITAVSGTVITLTHQIHSNREYTVYYNADTLIHGKTQQPAEASGSAEVALPHTLTVGMRITAVGIPAEEALLAKRIHIIPGKAKGIFNKQQSATPSGMIDTTPTPIASPTALPVTDIPTSIPTAIITATP